MRFLEFKMLLEYDRAKTLASYSNGIVSAAQSDLYLKSKKLDSNQTVDAVVDAAEKADPTNNKQYVQWILRQFIKNNLKYEDMYKLNDKLETFIQTKGQHKRLGINSDINSYNWKTLADVSAKLSSTDVADTKTADTETVPDAKILYNGPLGILSVPKTKEASCALGSGTQWCTAATKSDNMFDHYSKDGDLYIWNDKKRKAKFQFHFETGQFMDQNDNPIGFADAMYLLYQNPVTSKFFKTKSNELEETLENYRLNNLDDVDPDELDYDYERDDAQIHAEEIASEANVDFLVAFLNTKGLLAYYKLGDDYINGSIKRYLEFNSAIRSEFEQAYVKNPRLAYKYAEFFYKGKPAKHLESLIAQDARSAYLYAFHNLNKQRFLEGEPAIATDAWAATYYVKNVLHKRWPEAEQAIKQHPTNWQEYQAAIGATA